MLWEIERFKQLLRLGYPALQHYTSPSCAPWSKYQSWKLKKFAKISNPGLYVGLRVFVPQLQPHTEKFDPMADHYYLGRANIWGLRNALIASPPVPGMIHALVHAVFVVAAEVNNPRPIVEFRDGTLRVFPKPAEFTAAIWAYRLQHALSAITRAYDQHNAPCVVKKHKNVITLNDTVLDTPRTFDVLTGDSSTYWPAIPLPADWSNKLTQFVAPKTYVLYHSNPN